MFIDAQCDKLSSSCLKLIIVKKLWKNFSSIELINMRLFIDNPHHYAELVLDWILFRHPPDYIVLELLQALNLNHLDEMFVNILLSTFDVPRLAYNKNFQDILNLQNSETVSREWLLNLEDLRDLKLNHALEISIDLFKYEFCFIKNCDEKRKRVGARLELVDSVPCYRSDHSVNYSTEWGSSHHIHPILHWYFLIQSRMFSLFTHNKTEVLKMIKNSYSGDVKVCFVIAGEMNHF